MNDSPEKFHTGYLVEGLELLIRKVAYTKYDATGLVCWSNYTRYEVHYGRSKFGRMGLEEHITIKTKNDKTMKGQRQEEKLFIAFSDNVQFY
jgi:hypothetical protein